MQYEEDEYGNEEISPDASRLQSNNMANELGNELNYDML